MDTSQDGPYPGRTLERLISLFNMYEQLVIDLRQEIALLSGEEQTPLELVRAKDVARALLSFRRRLRGEYVGRMGDHFLQDPALEVLLEAFARQIEGRRVTLTTLHNKDESSQTTALRWGNKLVEMGLATRTPDHLDHRRELFALGPGLFGQLATMLNQICAT